MKKQLIVAIALASLVAACNKKRGAENGFMFEVGGAETTLADLMKKDPARVFDAEQRRYAIIEEAARREYLTFYFSNQAKQLKVTPEVAQRKFLADKIKIDEAEVKRQLAAANTDPRLVNIPAPQHEDFIRKQLRNKIQEEIFAGLFAAGIRAGEVKLGVTKPQEPTFNIVIGDNEPVKYGPHLGDIKPNGCVGDACVTITMYSNFKVPGCARTMATVDEVLKAYQGRVRFAIREFPVGSGKDAESAAVAAQCAGKQGKYWAMAQRLFKEQITFDDPTLSSYAKEIKLDVAEWKKCYEGRADEIEQINKVIADGRNMSVTSSPAIFLNKHRVLNLSDAVLKRAFDETIR